MIMIGLAEAGIVPVSEQEEADAAQAESEPCILKRIEYDGRKISVVQQVDLSLFVAF